jgi:hypothetical protein
LHRMFSVKRALRFCMPMMLWIARLKVDRCKCSEGESYDNT